MSLITKRQSRFLTRVVKIGNLFIGGQHSIKVQSMLTVPTSDTQAAIDQILSLENSGCDIVRMAVKNKKEAFVCETIKNELIRKKCLIPLVADVHFYPPAAMIALDFVDKVRINPGNFISQNEFASDEEFQNVLQDTFLPLIEKCKKLNKSLRLGVNYGSLAPRILKKYGDSIEGMIASIEEFTSVCRQFDFHDLVFSMKTSSPILTIEAYKQLVLKMQKLRWDYPLHLGVTEAGEGQDGIIRSSIGMGVLLLSGIGDTIRMSLTNDPIEEILPAKILVEHAQNTYETAIMQNNLPNNNPLILALKKEAIIPTLEKMLKKHIPLPYALLIDDAVVLDKRFSSLKVFSRHDKNLLFTDDGLTHADIQKYSMSFIKPNNKTILECVATLPLASNIALELDYGNNTEERVIKMASDLGFLFSSNYPFSIVAKNYDDYLIVLDVLQNLNLLNYRAEIISCPGCGRTLYDIQSVVKRIKAKMGHLNGVKIAIMGCIVNGIGEMADADFGYVGSKKGKIDLYVKKTCVERDIDFAQAEDKLMALIKAHGKWYEADS